MKKNYVLKGDIAFSNNISEISSIEDGYVVCEDGICRGAYKEIPAQYKDYEVLDYTGKIIVPGMTDLHVHAPQYTFRGIGMDLELLDWLNKYTFPEEAYYSDNDYAKVAYSYFTHDLKRGFTTRAVIFATRHNEATIELMDQLEETGLITYVGKVNMDRNSIPELQEESGEVSYNNTIKWLDDIKDRYKRTYPILTPRFIPSCTDWLMEKLGELGNERGLRIQSHLSENLSEIEWVKELVPESSCYANAYELRGAMGCKELPAIMAHCVHSDKSEREILKKHGTYVAHCPSSNMNLTSGIAPIRRFIDEGIRVGLGSDVAAGSSLNMLQIMLLTIQASKMYYRLVDDEAKALSFEEVFYMATMGGGEYFGRVGSFKDGFEFDALVLDDSDMITIRKMPVRERIERACYNDADVKILKKFVKGNLIFERN